MNLQVKLAFNDITRVTLTINQSQGDAKSSHMTYATQICLIGLSQAYNAIKSTIQFTGISRNRYSYRQDNNHNIHKFRINIQENNHNIHKLRTQ